MKKSPKKTAAARASKTSARPAPAKKGVARRSAAKKAASGEPARGKKAPARQTSSKKSADASRKSVASKAKPSKAAKKPVKATQPSSRPRSRALMAATAAAAAGAPARETVYTGSVTIYKLTDRPGCFYRGRMTVDADGSPRCYHPVSSKGLDSLANATSNSKQYIQGQNGVGPAPGFYVSQTSLQSGPGNRCDSFPDEEAVPYVVFYGNDHGTKLAMGDMGVVVSLKTGRRTAVIIGDSNPGTKGEASMRTAQNLGLNPSPRNGGDDNANYIYLLFPETKFAPLQPPPHWPEAKVQQVANAAFDAWGGMALLRQLYPQIP